MARKPAGISEPDFYDFLETAWPLSDSQLSRSVTFLTEIQQRRATYGTCQAMADQRTKEKKCPKGHHLIKYGKTKDGRQRYYCKTCKKAFTMSEGTIFGGTKLSEHDWEAVYQLICGNISLQQLATQANINIAWFIRQRIMAALSGIQGSVKLTGHIWIDELYKTHRRTDEKKKRGISRQQTPIYVAVDSHWNTLFLRSKADSKPTIEDAKAAIVPHLGENISMITTDKNSCYDFLDQLGYKHEAIKADVGSTEYEAKMKQVNDLCSHLRDKLVRHNGIADRYLQRYLDLFWMVFNFAHKGLNTEKITHYLEKRDEDKTHRFMEWFQKVGQNQGFVFLPGKCCYQHFGKISLKIKTKKSLIISFWLAIKG